MRKPPERGLKPLFHCPQIMVSLQIEPELRSAANEPRKPNRGFHGDRLLALQDAVQLLAIDAKQARNFSFRPPERGQGHVAQDKPRMEWLAFHFSDNPRRLRGRRHDASVFLYAFDLIELDGQDLRREPLQVRKTSKGAQKAAGDLNRPTSPPALGRGRFSASQAAPRLPS